MCTVFERVWINATRSINRESNQNCCLAFLMFFHIRNGSWLPDARSTRPERENCFLTLSGCDKVRQSRIHLVVATYGPSRSIDFNRNEIRLSALFVDLFSSERTTNVPTTPRGPDWKIARLFPTSSSTCLDLPPLSTYSFRQVVRI